MHILSQKRTMPSLLHVEMAALHPKGAFITCLDGQDYYFLGMESYTSQLI